MNESDFWRRLQKNVRNFGLFTRVESPICPGMFDVNYLLPGGVEGWIELKYRSAYPKRAETPVFGERGLSKEQIAWAQRRTALGGKTFICAGVASDSFLIRGAKAEQFNEFNSNELLHASCWACKNYCGWESFTCYLRSA